MDRDHLVASWARTRSRLTRAWVELPPGDNDLAWYQECLDHNELSLAMEALAEVGEGRGAGRLFWLALADAAAGMNMEQEEADYRRRSGGN